MYGCDVVFVGTRARSDGVVVKERSTAVSEPETAPDQVLATCQLPAADELSARRTYTDGRVRSC